ncbi:uncharacterized protein LOC109283336 isoform X1 [Alligator mississippiensis]|uniref:uncharacterized protein LOC109283336 isoform X1 n=1 Tax=Alligator mississippiensis TaxID=8496 RepID=UPI0028774726|nr:uncharacterized protein LOC109283336 isoform X1 [Alligator mississippiensis]XP_059585589.1 uncharacterized protein LOC109283336 isoform X1 [Alligator mississippiensis]XP_059585590.1 uncharacterized protein LOC109283336 isoform X1 [Alligator mississippiensis]
MRYCKGQPCWHSDMVRSCAPSSRILCHKKRCRQMPFPTDEQEEIIHHPQPCSLLLPYEGWSNCILFPRDVPDNSSEQDLGKSETNGSSKIKTGIAVAAGAETNGSSKIKTGIAVAAGAETNESSKIKTGIAVAVGAGISLVAAPLVLGAVGFTGAGIAAGSLAAKMMSTAAIANGGGVAAGSMVAVLQSAGAAGLSLTTNIGLGAVGGGAGAAINRLFTKEK